MTDPVVAACGVDPQELRDLMARLTAVGDTVGTAESLTAGLVAAVLTTVPGASAVVRGGLIVYATDLKHVLSDVDAGLLADVGAVHPEVARGLAAGARRRCGSTLGVGLTGVAGPDPQDGAVVGTVYVCVDRAGRRWESVDRFTGDRATIRAAAVRRALGLLATAAGAATEGDVDSARS